MKSKLPRLNGKQAKEQHFELLPRSRIMITKVIPIEKITDDIKTEDNIQIKTMIFKSTVHTTTRGNELIEQLHKRVVQLELQVKQQDSQLEIVLTSLQNQLNYEASLRKKYAFLSSIYEEVEQIFKSCRKEFDAINTYFENLKDIDFTAMFSTELQLREEKLREMLLKSRIDQMSNLQVEQARAAEAITMFGQKIERMDGQLRQIYSYHFKRNNLDRLLSLTELHEQLSIQWRAIEANRGQLDKLM